jgi:hypothetical protein
VVRNEVLIVGLYQVVARAAVDSVEGALGVGRVDEIVALSAVEEVVGSGGVRSWTGATRTSGNPLIGRS